MTSFTPVPALIGGVSIGLAASILLVFDGRIAGISGIVGGLLTPRAGDLAWRALFVAGLVLGGILLGAADPGAFPAESIRPIGIVAVAGLLVGFGTRLGSGCTSGHGVCGLSRASPRSLVATVTFIGVGMATVSTWRLMVGP